MNIKQIRELAKKLRIEARKTVKTTPKIRDMKDKIYDDFWLNYDVSGMTVEEVLLVDRLAEEQVEFFTKNKK